MPTIILSKTTLDMLNNPLFRTPGWGWKSDAVRRPDGMFDVPIDQEVRARLDLMLHPTDGDDAAVRRLVEFASQGGRRQ
jgi:hypothetical protein